MKQTIQKKRPQHAVQVETIKIMKVGINGEGIGYIHKKPIFVPHVLLDEVCEVEIIETEDTYLKGKCKKIIKESPLRVKPLCPVCEKCGGCPLMIAKPSYQAKVKRNLLQEALIKYAHVSPQKVGEIVTNKNLFNYRNQCKMPVEMKDGKLVSGMYQSNSNRLVPIEKCVIHQFGIDRIRAQVLTILNEAHFPDYSKNGLKTIVLRGFEEKFQLCLVTGKIEIDSKITERLSQIKGVVSVSQNIQTNRKARELFSPNFKFLTENHQLEFSVLGQKLRLSDASFYQLNTTMAEVLYQDAVELIKPCHTLVEAYCGIGAMSILCKDKAKEVIGIEIVRSAIDNAKLNARLNRCEDHVYFMCADAGKELVKLAQKKRVDALIVDPPRSGLDDVMLEAIFKAKPKQIVYVSCNPSTLAKNLAVLQKEYEIEKIQGYDLFSHTPHVETIVSLVKKA